MGPQAAVPTLAAGDSEKRFFRTFLAFVSVFAQRDHPLTLFIDDLQWSDALSLQLLRALFSQPSAYLLLIGAYRDNETSPSHPLMRLIEELKAENDNDAIHRIHNITLQPLALPHITALVQDSLHCSAAAASDLSKLLLTRTQGNPFFISSILTSLYSDRLIAFDYKLGRWVWDMEALRFANISSDVVELLCAQIQRLDAPAAGGAEAGRLHRQHLLAQHAGHRGRDYRGAGHVGAVAAHGHRHDPLPAQQPARAVRHRRTLPTGHSTARGGRGRPPPALITPTTAWPTALLSSLPAPCARAEAALLTRPRQPPRCLSPVLLLHHLVPPSSPSSLQPVHADPLFQLQVRLLPLRARPRPAGRRVADPLG